MFVHGCELHAILSATLLAHVEVGPHGCSEEIRAAVVHAQILQQQHAVVGAQILCAFKDSFLERTVDNLND